MADQNFVEQIDEDQKIIANWSAAQSVFGTVESFLVAAKMAPLEDIMREIRVEVEAQGPRLKPADIMRQVREEVEAQGQPGPKTSYEFPKEAYVAKASQSSAWSRSPRPESKCSP